VPEYLHENSGGPRPSGIDRMTSPNLHVSGDQALSSEKHSTETVSGEPD